MTDYIGSSKAYESPEMTTTAAVPEKVAPSIVATQFSRSPVDTLRALKTTIYQI